MSAAPSHRIGIIGVRLQEPCTPSPTEGAYAGTRPQTCVAFVAGSPKCQELRAERGKSPVVPQPAVHRVLAEIVEAALSAQVEERASRHGAELE